MKKNVNILHLSDIHFGFESENEITLISQRENVLNVLIQNLKKIDVDWKPDVIVISGDIGWKGSSKDYEIAKKWIDELLLELQLSPNELILCAGNHDLLRNEAIGMDYTDEPKKADFWLQLENLKSFERLFSSFIDFCKELNIPKLKIFEQDSYLLGIRELYDLRFIVLNSAWFCRGNDDKGKLWIGLPQLELMNAKNQLISDVNYNEEKVSIAVMHHPAEWLNNNEIHSYLKRPNTYNFLADRSHLILSGHVHGEIKRPSRVFNRSQLFTAGATYSEKYYKNNFSILKINLPNRSVTRKSFEYVPEKTKWKEIPDYEEYSLTINNSHGVFRLNDNESEFDANELILSSKEYIQKYLNNKSRIIARTKKLPRLIERKVAWHSSEERIYLDEERNLKLNTKNNIATLSEMVFSEKPIFLFGELGSGKSTIVSQFLINLANPSKGILPLLIPASFFSGKEIKVINDLVKFINDYVDGQLIPQKQNFDLNDTLKNRIEVTLVIDGFDELHIVTAQQLLLKASELRDSWSGLRIIATGRPIELAGLNYNNWQCLEMVPLTNQEIADILLEDALADDLNNEEAVKDSENRMGFLNERAELLGVTTTPLSIRLLRPYLTEEIENKSLGDLIYDIILERLGSWDVKDNKDNPCKQFIKYYPNSISRQTILGEIAKKIFEAEDRTITREQLFTILDEIIIDCVDKNIVVEEAIVIFEKCLLQNENEKLSFPSQPFLQVSLGMYIYEQLTKSNPIKFRIEATNLWREYSFVATIARRKNKMSEIVESLFNYFDEILKNENLIPAGAIIVSESENEELAKYFINKIAQFEFRPLKYFQDIKTQSIRAIAHSIFLAGDRGFDWFYNEYLDPKYPADHHYSDEEYYILQHWFTFNNFEISTKLKAKLSSILKPHIIAKDWACHKLPETLVMVMPEQFDKNIEILLYISNINSRLFGKIASKKLKEEYNSGNQDIVLRAIEIFVDKDHYPNKKVLQLWLELTDTVPQKYLVKSIISTSVEENDYKLLEVLENRIGKKTFESILKFYLFKNTKISAKSAICLYERGYREFYPLSTGLLEGLHDGDKIPEAEKILHSLISEKGIEGISWLIDKFLQSNDYYGAYSSYWRILLIELNKQEKSYVNLFSQAIPYLGEFILPRYPEIRLGFQELLTSKSDYKDYLIKSLKNINNIVRYNSACILLSSFPNSELKACEIIIKSVKVYFQKTEWLSFCLRLSLDKELLNYIASIVENLISVSKTFALSLLYHNNYSLSSELYEELIKGLLNNNSNFDNLDPYRKGVLKKILAEDESFELLIKYLYHENIKIASEAASALLVHHENKLSHKDYGRSWSLYVKDNSAWNIFYNLDKSVENILPYNERLKTVKDIFQKISIDTSKEPLASLYLQSFDNPSIWKEILWVTICGKRIGSREIAESCVWIFNKARKDKKIAEVIGKASVEFIENPSINKDRFYNDIIPWLTFLADEFCNLDAGKLKNTIENSSPIQSEIISALIARLGDDNVNYRNHRNESSSLVFRGFKVETKHEISFEKIQDLTRDSEEIHPDLVDFIEEVILSNSFSHEQLSQIATKSKFSAIFSIIVQFCTDTFRDVHYLGRILGFALTNDVNKNKSAKYVLTALNNIIMIIENNEELSEKFYQNIKETIKTQNHEETIELYKFLLERNNLFDASDLTNLLADIATREYMLDFNLANRLLEYFLNVDFGNNDFVLKELKKIISTMNEKELKDDLEYKYEGLSKLLFSLAVFYFQQKIDNESCEVFLKGLKYVFFDYYKPVDARNNKTRLKGRSVLKSVSPLIAQIDPILIRECINIGIESEDPELSSLCYLLKTFD